MKLTHLSLFSGIGGLDLAAEWAGFKTVGQCEYADYPYKVLCKHWKDVQKWRDIHELTVESFRERTGLQTVDCISGGFPCQPHSLAGKRKASADERDLWGEMRRVVREIRPKWVVAENVYGLLSSENGRFFGRVLRDFSDMGYDVGWGVIRASDAGAIHQRQRIAIVGWNALNAEHQTKRKIQKMEGKKLDGTIGGNPNDTNAAAFGRGRWDECSDKRERISEVFRGGLITSISRECLAESAILRGDDGFPTRLDKVGRERIKCLGNAVVPQQFYPVFRAIAEIEGELNEQEE